MEDKLNEVFPENEGDCNLTKLEQTIKYSFASAFTFIISLFIALLYFLGVLFSFIKEPDYKNTNFQCVWCCVTFVCFFIESGLTLISVLYTRDQIVCLGEVEEFQELAVRMERLIILDFIYLPIFLIGCCIGFTQQMHHSAEHPFGYNY